MTLVTYRWLSKKLNIHTNTSKQFLHAFCKKNCDANLQVTFVIIGSKSDSIKVYLVGQSGIDKIKNGLDKVLSEHVYSIQKASCTAESLYLADSTAPNSQNTLSSIVPRDVEERQFKIVLPEKTCKPNPPPKVQQKEPNKPLLFSGKALTNLKKVEESRKEPENGKETVSSKISAAVKIVSPTKYAAKKKSGSIGAFFNKQNAINIEKKKNEPQEQTTEEKPAEQLEVERCSAQEEDVQKITSDDESTDRNIKTPVTQKKKQTCRSRTKKRKGKGDHDNSLVKRRKRIVLASDSESGTEEEMDVEEEPDPEPCQPSHQVSDSDDEVIPPTPYGEKPKRRIRKQVDKTYLDEDGFIVTKKEFVYDSCSDDDEKELPEDVSIDTTKSLNKQIEVNQQQNHNIKKEEVEQSNKLSDKEKSKEKKTYKKSKLSDSPKKSRKSFSPKKSSHTFDKKQASIVNFFIRK